MLINLTYPTFQPRLEKRSGKTYLFDELRKKWLLLTPEEWVRQHLIQLLIQVYQYPAALIAIEKQVPSGTVLQRFDLVVHHRNGTPWMLIECKESSVPLDDKVLSQAIRYQLHVQAAYLVITNGAQAALFEVRSGTLKNTTKFPDFPLETT